MEGTRWLTLSIPNVPDLYDVLDGAHTQAAVKESKEKAKSVFGGLFGKVSMYGDKEGVVTFNGTNPKCFFDVKVISKFCITAHALIEPLKHLIFNLLLM